MHFVPEVHDRAFPGLVAAFGELVGLDRLRRRFAWLDEEVARNGFMEGWLRERCALEWTLRDILASDRVSLLTPLRVENEAEYELVAFLAGMWNIYRRLTPAGQVRLRGRLIDGIQTDQGLLAVQHEVTTVAHLMSRGFDVQCHDLESGGGFDFLATRGSVEAEVECKMASGDIGRKIHKRKSLMLFKALEDVVSRTYSSVSVGLVIRVTIPDRLSGKPDDHRMIANTLGTALLCGGRLATDTCSVAAYEFQVAGSPFDVTSHAEVSKPAVSELVARLTGQSNTHSMSFFSPGKRAVVLVIDSMKHDKVLGAVHSVLRDAALRQFTKTRPGYLAVQLHDLPDEQMAELASADSSDRQSATALQIMTSDLLDRPSRTHVHSVVYRAHGGRLIDSEDVKTASGLAYYIVNQNHVSAKDQSYAIFNDPARPRSGRIVLAPTYRLKSSSLTAVALP